MWHLSLRPTLLMSTASGVTPLPPKIATAIHSGLSFKALLSQFFFFFFDVRNDSDALYSHYNIAVDAIIDVQLLELAMRDHSVDFVAGAAKYIQKDSTASAAVKLSWQRTKERVSRLYDPYKGGNFDVFNGRPLKPEILRYCKQDVELLPSLWEVYSSKLRLPGMACWRQMVRQATQERIKLSKSKNYDGQAKSKVCGPWDSLYIEKSIEDGTI
jgi:exonuclease 3'-5' domain-containing protein 1